MSPRESYSNAITCVLRGRNAIREAGQAARMFGEAQQLTGDECARLCIIVEELIANLHDHGGLTDQDEVELTLGSEPAGIRIIIADRAKPFDPRSARPQTKRPERGGGAGIEIVRTWARLVDYSVRDDGNRLELLLPRRGPTDRRN